MNGKGTLKVEKDVGECGWEGDEGCSQSLVRQSPTDEGKLLVSHTSILGSMTMIGDCLFSRSCLQTHHHPNQPATMMKSIICLPIRGGNPT